jgi:dTDP-glucose 4,6-dehydratase
MGVEIEIVTDEERFRPEKSEVTRLWADNTKAAELLGWRPAYGGREGFKRGLQETVDWFAAEGKLGRYKADRYNV